jgi:hemerythrin-like domain-containing protein
MRSDADQGRRGDCLRPTDPSLLSDPLTFFHEDHLREREICAMLERIATADTPRMCAVTHVLGFLREELPLHLEDEEQDLFPLLRRRCEPSDEIGKAIDRLAGDHRLSDAQTPPVVAALARLERGGESLSADERERVVIYVGHARSHLIFENAIILPFARLRLTESDLQTLTLRMRQRRGLGR